MNAWKKAVHLPTVVEFREVVGVMETIPTLEGTLKAVKSQDYIIKGTHGELYPIKKEIFHDNYEVVT